MKIEKQTNGNSMTLVVSGRLDTVTSQQFETEIKEIPADITDLVFDFSGLDYISSAGLRVLLSAQKKMNNNGNSMKVTGANEMVREIFDVTGFSDIMTIE